MIREGDKIHCTGCNACVNVCPQSAIQQVPDSEGFLYPRINNALCIECAQCLSVCQIFKPLTNTAEKNQKYYAAIHKDPDVLLKSSSGGAFSALAKYVSDKNGVVIGCTFDEDMNVVHVAAEPKDGYAQFRGSKYVQSNCGDIYLQTKKYLNDNRFVLFTGTPCQIAALKAFLNKDYPLLITVDIICHGVPSPALWKMHVALLEEKGKRKLLSYEFRNKSKVGWSLYYYYYYAGKKKPNHGISNLDAYYSSFLRGENYRECCYSCRYASLVREGDFSIGDYWGINEFHSDINSKKGVSLVLANTKKAHELLPELSKSMELIPTKRKWCIKNNRNLVSPTPKPQSRISFYKTISEKGYKQWEREFRHTKEWYIVKCKSFIPVSIKNIVKKILHMSD
jgi:Pyruvate/2-oxoacid:ferredoxin oxidoreductase delta subunit